MPGCGKTRRGESKIPGRGGCDTDDRHSRETRRPVWSRPSPLLVMLTIGLRSHCIWNRECPSSSSKAIWLDIMGTQSFPARLPPDGRSQAMLTGPDRPKPKEWNQWNRWTPAADAKDARRSTSKSCPAVETAHLRMAQTERRSWRGRALLRRIRLHHTGRETGVPETVDSPVVLHFHRPTGLQWVGSSAGCLLGGEHPCEPWLLRSQNKDHPLTSPPPRWQCQPTQPYKPAVSISPGPLRLCWQRAVSATHHTAAGINARDQINSLTWPERPPAHRASQASKRSQSTSKHCEPPATPLVDPRIHPPPCSPSPTVAPPPSPSQGT